jgi:hypothetical protein
MYAKKSLGFMLMPWLASFYLGPTPIYKAAQNTFEKIPAKFKELVCKPDYPEILNERIIELKSNRILC